MLNEKGIINQKVQRFLMAYRTTPHSATNCTPAELLFGRRLQTALDIIKPGFSNNMEKTRDDMICRAQNRRMREFSDGQEVFISNFGVGSRWISGVIVNASGPVTWLIKLEDGKTVIRHANHTRNRYIQSNDEKFEKNEIKDNLQLPDSTVMPNQSNSPQTTEPTESTQDLDNSNSPSEEVSETPLRRSSRI